MRSDYETWQAMHADCGEDATCCAGLSLELDLDMLSQLRVLAFFEHEPVDALLHRIISEAVAPVSKCPRARRPIGGQTTQS